MDTLLILTANIFIFAILAWYFDHVFASNRGVAEYFFQPP